MMTLRIASEIQAKLLDVLALDTEDTMIRRTIEDAERALTTLDNDAEYQRLVREAEDWADRHDDIEQRIAHLESDIDVATKRIAHDREREKSSGDPKELSSLEHEIASLERRIELLEEQEIEVLAERDEIIGSWNAVKIARDSFHDNAEGERDRLRDEILASERRRADIVTARAALVAELPTELIELYERQRERYGVGASLLQRGITSASGVALSAGQIHEVRSADPDEVILCPDSNAILIRTAESGL